MHYFQKNLFSYIILGIALFMFAIPLSVFAACNFHNVSGYVWSRNTGWISLNCSAGGTVDYGLNIDFESGAPTEPVAGYAWSSNLGWLNMQPSGPYPSWGSVPASAATFYRNEGGGSTTTAGVIKGWAKWEALGVNGWVVMGPIDISSTDYGVVIGADRLFSGWSWSGGDNLDADPEPERGDGWVLWDSVASGGGASVLAYWFETLYGDMYSGGAISAPFAPPIGRYTALYLIQANGTIHPVSIQSAGGGSLPYISESFGSISIPDEANNYRGTLGWLDKAGLLGGRYGTLESALPAGSSVLLDGKVYHYTSDLVINSDITFNKGTGTQKGSGTIIVDGDLTINANLFYQSGAVSSRVDNLPSVAWIVTGDIIINPSVQNLVGVLYSEGSISTGTTGANDTDMPITIEGMLIANQINLQRLFADETQEPAEQIIFDGRAIINPPPGLTDIGKGLPTLRETRP
ncbi:hypothetical protein BK004_00040 [bacterium CG10_46_32]|nr:MAG: hypothetical protein BK004_00040 [bacterium CG10_46_32]PIR56513.1 MAG: hypothetical protein COU73_00040 [Parcubacteria group bacterium CG10_big_fil_rev_8_21_14_0_10_46_32]